MIGKVRAYKPKTFLAILVENNRKSLQIYDPGSLLHLAEQRVERINEGFRFYLCFYSLIESKH